MRKLSGISLTAVLLVLGIAHPASAQEQPWQNRWYWGAQGGMLVYATPTAGYHRAWTVGGHWFITKRNTALHLSYDDIFFRAGTTSRVSTGTGTADVQFSRGNRVQALLYVIPGGDVLQLRIGGGFAIQSITNATTTAAGAAALDDADSQAFFVLATGLTFRMGGIAVYGEYQYVPPASNYLIVRQQHALTAGIQISLSSASSEVGTR